MEILVLKRKDSINLMKNKLITIGIIVAILFLIGYFSYKSGYNKALNSVKSEVIYVKGDTIYGELPELIPDTVYLPSEPTLPTKPDTIIIDSIHYIVQTVDTMAILSDYILKRSYSKLLFDTDTIGKLQVGWNTQYNKSSDLWYNFIPYNKQTTIIKPSKIKRFRVMAGIGTNNYYSAQFQVNISENWVIGYQYLNNFSDKQNNHLLNIGIDF